MEAKVLILGDSGVGKSELIQRLTASDGSVDANVLFGHLMVTTCLLPLQSIRHSSTSVTLKFWEYSSLVKESEEERIFHGVLFVLVIFNICDSNTANEAFNRWVGLKEKYCPESLLFIVGTHVDQVTQRRVKIKHICKAASQKDALYLEVSNSDGTNIDLLRKLLSERLVSVLDKIKDIQSFVSKLDSEQEPQYDSSNALSDSAIVTSENDEVPRSISAVKNRLDQNILCDSTGSILASYLDLDQWKGLTSDSERVRRAGERILRLIDELPDGIDDELTDDEVELESVGNTFKYDKNDFNELKDAYQIMGLKFPDSIGGTHIDPNIPKPSQRLKKYKVNLPDESTAELLVDLDGNIEEQVEMFMILHSLNGNPDIKRKLLSNISKSAAASNQGEVSSPMSNGGHSTNSTVSNRNNHKNRKAATSATAIASDRNVFKTTHATHSVGPESHHSSAYSEQDHPDGSKMSLNDLATERMRPKSAKKKFKVRITLPDRNTPIEFVVKKGDVADDVIATIVLKYNVPQDHVDKVRKQLEAIFRESV